MKALIILAVLILAPIARGQERNIISETTTFSIISANEDELCVEKLTFYMGKDIIPQKGYAFWWDSTYADTFYYPMLIEDITAHLAKTGDTSSLYHQVGPFWTKVRPPACDTLQLQTLRWKAEWDNLMESFRVTDSITDEMRKEARARDSAAKTLHLRKEGEE